MGIMVILETASLWIIHFSLIIIVKGKNEKLGRMGVLHSADTVNSGLFESG